MEFLGKQAFEHLHKESVVGNPDRGCFDRQMLEDSVDQNLSTLLVEMKVVEFALVATKGSIHQYHNPNQDRSDLVVDRYNLVAAATSHNMVIQLVNK